MTARAYPLPRPKSGNDPRFTFGLQLDMADVLEKHGFPKLSGVELAELGLALFRFIYATEARPVPPVEDDSPLTFGEYRDAIPYWQSRVESAESAGDEAAAERSRRCLKLLQERVARAEVVAQRCDWHPDLSEAQVLVLASRVGKEVAR